MSYFASATFQHTAGFIAGTQKSCAHDTILAVTDALCKTAPEIIKMPSKKRMQQSAEFFRQK
jgi:hypothetical protein